MYSPIIHGNLSWSDVSYDTSFIYKGRQEQKKISNTSVCYCFIMFGAICSISYIIMNNLDIDDIIHNSNKIDNSQSGSY